MVRNLILLGFLCRIYVAGWFGINEYFFGIGADAMMFQNRAVEYSRDLVWDGALLGLMYSYVLGIVYYATTDSLLLGCFLSVAAWLASALVLVKLMRILSMGKASQSAVMLVYALLPSAIPNTAVTFREPYQLLFVNLAVYATLKIYLHRSHSHWLLLALAVLGMGVLHGALFALGLFIVVSTLLLLVLRGRSGGATLVKLLIAVPLVVMIASYGISLFSNVAYTLDDGLAIAVQSFQEGALGTDARTNYKESAQIDGLTGLPMFILSCLFQYLFEPMPWRVGTVPDAVLVLENFLRAWLIWKSVVGLRNLKAPTRLPVLFVFLSYLVVETIWSLGTINWGTASRHHIPSMGLLLVAAYAYAGDPQRFRRAVPRRRSPPLPSAPSDAVKT